MQYRLNDRWSHPVEFLRRVPQYGLKLVIDIDDLAIDNVEEEQDRRRCIGNALDEPPALVKRILGGFALRNIPSHGLCADDPSMFENELQILSYPVQFSKPIEYRELKIRGRNLFGDLLVVEALDPFVVCRMNKIA